MLTMDVVFRQILIIFGYVAVGIGCGKLGLINPAQRKYLTRLCSDLMLPFVVLSAASMEAGGTELMRFVIALGVILLLMALTMGITLGTCRAVRAERKTMAAVTGLTTFPNCTFLGLPLCTALFGSIAILYNAACIVSFNVLFFTVEITLFTGEKFRPKALLTVPTCCTAVLLVMLAAGLHWPAPVQTVLSNVGGMITPMSLIIIGVMLAESDVLSVLKEKKAYLVTAVRNLAVPLAAILVLRFVPLDLDTKLCVLVYIATPCATLTSIYAISTDSQPELCARTILLSTLAFALTLPLVIAAGQAMLA